MIDTLSDATRVAMGALDPDLEPASLEAIVQASLEAMGAGARSRVELQTPDGPHLIGLWDPHLLHRLVANVVGNGPQVLRAHRDRPGHHRTRGPRHRAVDRI